MADQLFDNYGIGTGSRNLFGGGMSTDELNKLLGLIPLPQTEVGSGQVVPTAEAVSRVNVTERGALDVANPQVDNFKPVQLFEPSPPLNLSAFMPSDLRNNEPQTQRPLILDPRYDAPASASASASSSIIPGMFPEVEAMQRALYQQKQNEAMQAQAMQFARLDPFEKASYGLAMGGQQLGDAIGGALGAKDPQMQMISLQNQMLRMVDPNKPETYDRAISLALQTGDRNTALMLNDEKKNAQARKTQALDTYAQQLLPTLKNADGTINEQVKLQLLAFPQGRAAISELAKVIPDLRRIGAAGGQEDDPFAVFTQDTTIPVNVKKVATQYSKSLKDGVLDPEKVDAKVRELADMTQRAQQFEQNQAQIKAQQQVLNSLKEQGLENSTQALGIQRSLLALQQQNATFNQETKLAEIDRKKEEAATKAEAAKNKPLPANLSKAEEEDFDVATTTTNLATDAYSFVNRIKSGDIKFGLKDRASILARSKFGSGAPDVIARRDYDKFVERLVSENLRLNKGTQTDKDFERELSLLQSAESAEDAAQIMNNLVNINVRKTQDAATAISRRRVNAGFGEPPVGVSVPKFEPHTFTQKEVDAFLKNPKYPSGTIFVDPDGKRKVKP
jgi:hypothetical protein